MRGSRLALALLVLGCGGASTATSEPLTYVDREVGGGQTGDELPLVVALHGRGDQPERFLEVFEALDRPARVVSVRAPIDEGRGRAWFVFRYGFEAAMRDMDALLPRLATTIARYRESHPTRDRPILLGFSQGAMIAHAYAVQRPEELRAVYPVAGALPEDHHPDRATAARMPPVRAFHGSRDEVIGPTWGRNSVRALQDRGADATFTLVDGAPHWMTRPMCEAVFTSLRRDLE